MQITILLMQSCSFLLKSFKIIMAKLEVRLGYAIFPAAKFFTDDLVISSTCKEKLSAINSSFYDGLDIKFLASKNFIMTNAQMLIGWIVDDATIEEVLEAEYLGVQNEVDWCIRVPSATSLVFFWMDVELLLVRIRIMINQASFNCAVVMKLWNPMILDGMTLNKPRKSSGTLSEICTTTNFQRKKERILTHFCFPVIEQTTMAFVPQPEWWVSFQEDLINSAVRRIHCCIRGGKTFLGDRFKIRYGHKNASSFCKLACYLKLQKVSSSV